MKTLPIIRHVRYFWHKHQMLKHYDFWRSLGYLPVHVEHDLAVLNDIWSGKR
jgi:hypothetical protein